jgi:tRNA(fMet)-specific endonuclease VapC
MKYVLDTNIVTAILKGDENLIQKIINIIQDGKIIFINAITYYEIKRGLLAINAFKKLKVFEALCKKYDIIFLDNRSILDTASNIYSILKKKGEPIGDADILIASMAMYYNYILVSNDSHFKRIKNLQLEDWLT